MDRLLARPPASFPTAPLLGVNSFDGKAFAAQLSNAPGVYRMYGLDERLLYVGKAGALRKRVASYFNASPKTRRLKHMLAQVVRMDVTVTSTEAEALLLENQLIKSLAPRYNVMWRDDKSYPYIFVSNETWPRISLHRGTRALIGHYYGPYPNVGGVRDTLNLLHKLFKLRNCENSAFKHRSRPCLQYQIGRCSAPCVGYVSPADYQQAVQHATLFLQGKSDRLIDDLSSAMLAASGALEFERAAQLRDLVASLRSLHQRQYVDGQAADLDVLACAMQGSHACVLLLSFRDGRNLGTRTFFPRTQGEESPEIVLGAFISQYYAEHLAPREVILDRPIAESAFIAAALSAAAQHNVCLKWNVRGQRAGYVALAARNAQLGLVSERDSQGAQRARSQALVELLALSAPLQRAECFDISHTQGEATVAACVVFDATGPLRNQYRRYTISGITPGDDCAAMRQVIERRFRHLMADDADSVLPDIVLIDGGRGQLTQVRAVLAELELESMMVIAVAKGVTRRPGDETLIFPDGRQLHPGAASPALQFVQQMRDEAHRFAISGHRHRRQKASMTSKLEAISGIGGKRRARLLKHFGGLAGLKAAGVAEIAQVEGINTALAERVYAHLHDLLPKNTPAVY